jgi:hypothetical protein
LVGADIADDYEAIDSVALYYYDDGTAVKKTTGQAATVPTIDASGEAFFQDLDLIIEDGESTLVEVRVDLREMDDNDSNATAQSGMAFAAALVLDEDKAEVRGVDSGDTYTSAEITSDVEALGDDSTNAGDTMYVLNNKVIAELGASQTTGNLTNTTELELLKFTANSSGDNSDAPFLYEVVANISTTGAVTVTNVELYNDNNTLISTAQVAGDVHTFLVGDVNGNGVIDGAEVVNDEIDGGTETYIIKGDTALVAANNAVTTSISINSSTLGNDGITWQDGGSDGTDGVRVQWIDLGEADTSTTKIEWTIDNN